MINIDILLYSDINEQHHLDQNYYFCILLMTLVHANELNLLFENKIRNLNVDFEETKAYILGIYIEHISKNIVISPKESISLRYLESNSFIDFQNLADHLLISRSFFPKSLAATPDFYDSVAKLSYHKCFLLVNKQWPVFEELANRFSYLVGSIQI